MQVNNDKGVVITDGKCPVCNSEVRTIHSLDWEKEEIDPKTVPSWGVPAKCEEGHILIKDGRITK
jgi:hypothetical protein